MWGAESQSHHDRKIEPGWLLAIQFQSAPHAVVPQIKYPFGDIMIFFPSFRRVFGWMKVPQSMRLRFDDFCIAALFLVYGIPLGRDAVSMQLATISLFIQVQLVNLQDRS